MGTVYAFFADGFEEIEAFTAVDTLRRAGLNVQIVSVTPDEIVMGAHDVSLLCDINFENCDFFDADLLLLPGGMPGAATLDKLEQYLEGAECVSEPVVRDGNIITGMGPGAAMEFALTIVDLLVGKEKVDELVEAMCVKH